MLVVSLGIAAYLSVFKCASVLCVYVRACVCVYVCACVYEERERERDGGRGASVPY